MFLFRDKTEMVEPRDALRDRDEPQYGSAIDWEDEAQREAAERSRPWRDGRELPGRPHDR